MSNNKLSKYVGGSDDSGNSLVPFSSRSFFELDNWVDSLFNDFWREPAFLRQRNWRFSEAVEDENSVTISVELPGFKKSEVNVSAKDNGILVSAKNSKSSYTRSFFDNRVDYSKSDVKLEDGVLTIKTPKREEAKAKQIEIK